MRPSQEAASWCLQTRPWFDQCKAYCADAALAANSSDKQLALAADATQDEDGDFHDADRALDGDMTLVYPLHA